MRRFFSLYEWLGPLLLTPIAVLLWVIVAHGNANVVAMALLVPIVQAYVVPGIGTNVLKVWAFDSRTRIGNFRPQHGFLFGSATASLTALIFLCCDAAGIHDAAFKALAAAVVLTAINWWYDAVAIRHGVLSVYNQRWADGAGPVAIAGDYVIWFFGVFGLIYAGGVALALDRLPDGTPLGEVAAYSGVLLGATLLVPTALYVGASHLRHGHSGCRPVERLAA